jgi:hypothetical protein
MSFIRLCDSYIDHPKFTALSASAFRLWHEGMAFCRKHQTDGTISMVALEGFRYYQPARVKELTVLMPGEGGPLWEAVDGYGFRVRNYLKWNLSREEEESKKQESRDRSSRWRQKRFQNASRDASPDAHVPNMDMDRSSRSSERVQGKPTPLPNLTADLAERAGRFIEEYEALYALDFERVCGLCRTWDDDRLRKLAEVFLTSDEDWISKTDRGLAVFTAKATWCDERLAAWEAQKARRA